MKKRIVVQPNTPAALKRDLRKCNWNMRALARMRGVNIFWVSRLLRYGEEPKNSTTRLKLSLSKRPRKPRVPGPPKPPVPDYIRWWRKLEKVARDMIVKSVYDGFQEYQKKNNA
jgi:hypothetical protein